MNLVFIIKSEIYFVPSTMRQENRLIFKNWLHSIKHLKQE
jgi:hypothetical protein